MSNMHFWHSVAYLKHDRAQGNCWMVISSGNQTRFLLHLCLTRFALWLCLSLILSLLTPGLWSEYISHLLIFGTVSCPCDTDLCRASVPTLLCYICISTAQLLPASAGLTMVLSSAYTSSCKDILHNFQSSHITQIFIWLGFTTGTCATFFSHYTLLPTQGERLDRRWKERPLDILASTRYRSKVFKVRLCGYGMSCDPTLIAAKEDVAGTCKGVLQ